MDYRIYCSISNKDSTLIMYVWCLQLDLWYVILNGAVEISYPDSRMETLCMGNSFGISPSLDKQYMHGEVRTKGDDCQVKKTLKQHLILFSNSKANSKISRKHFCSLCSFLSTHLCKLYSHWLVPLLVTLFPVFI